MNIDVSQFSKREKDTIKLLLQGKSNKHVRACKIVPLESWKFVPLYLRTYFGPMSDHTPYLGIDHMHRMSFSLYYPFGFGDQMA